MDAEASRDLASGAVVEHAAELDGTTRRTAVTELLEFKDRDITCVSLTLKTVAPMTANVTETELVLTKNALVLLDLLFSTLLLSAQSETTLSLQLWLLDKLALPSSPKLLEIMLKLSRTLQSNAPVINSISIAHPRSLSFHLSLNQPRQLLRLLT